MAAPIKLHYDRALAQELAARVAQVYPAFDQQTFIDQVAERLPALELKARIAVLAEGLRCHLPTDYGSAVGILCQTLPPALDGEGMYQDDHWLWPLATFVEMYGQNHWQASMDAIYQITQCFTGEFAIRPLITRYPERTLAALAAWAHDPSPHVRRLVSEGTRPRLPWAGHLSMVRDHPELTLPLLTALRDDPERYVQRSVANHLNDLSKDHPALILDTLTEWQVGAPPGRQWIIGHALRTLLKAGEPRALRMLGYLPPRLSVSELALEPDHLPVGATLNLQCTLVSQAEVRQKLLINIRLSLMDPSTRLGDKLFRWTICELAAGQTRLLNKRLPLRAGTTQQYPPGKYEVSIEVNGVAHKPQVLDIEQALGGTTA